MKFARCFFILFLLTACAGRAGPDSGALRAPEYDKYGITNLNVGDVQIVNSYVPPYHAPNVEHELYLPPYVAVRDWAQSRFRAVGTDGVAKIEILDASIIKHDLPVRGGFGGWFGDQINAEYRLHIKVRTEVISPEYENLPFAEVEVTRTIQTTDNTTLAQRDAQLHDMVSSALDELNKLMTQSLHDKLSDIAH